MRRLRAVLVLLLTPAAVCQAQDTARMEQVVQSFATSKTFSGSILVARGDQVIRRSLDARRSIRGCCAALSNVRTPAACVCRRTSSTAPTSATP